MPKDRPLRGSVSRADLLELLHLGQTQGLPLMPTAQALAPGYVLQVLETADAQGSLKLPARKTPRRDGRKGLAPSALPPLQQPGQWVMTAWVGEAVAAPPPTPALALQGDAVMAERPSLEDAEQAAKTLPPVADWVGLAPRLRSPLAGLGMNWQRQLDWPRLLRRLAGARLLWPLPWQAQRRWPTDLVVVLDRQAPALLPWRRDMDVLARHLWRQHGGAGLSVRVVVPEEPQAPWLPWLGQVRPEARQQVSQQPIPWQNPPEGTVVLVLSDMGLLTPTHVERWQAWHRWAQRMQQAGVRLLGLLPLHSTHVLGLPVVQPVPWLAWGERAARVRWGRPAMRAPALAAAQALPGVLTLLAMVAVIGRVYPALLRALRLGLPQPQASQPGLELLVWNHPDVMWREGACEIRPEALPRWAGAAHELSRELWCHLLTCRRLFQAGLPVLDGHLQELRCASMAPQGVQQMLVQHVELAQQALAQVAQPVASHEQAEQSLQALQCLLQAPPVVRAAQAEVFAGLYRVAFSESLARGQAAPWLEGVMPEAAAASSQQPQAVAVQLVQRPGGALCLVLAGKTQQVEGCLLGPAVPGRVFWLRLGAQVWSLTPGQLAQGQVLPLVTGVQQIELESETCRAVWGLLPRPSWAQGWGGALHNGRWQWVAHGYGLNGQLARLVLHQEEFPARWEALALPQSQPRKRSGKSVACSHGVDEFGLYADLEVGRVVQRLRWIAPGSFLMGSPQTEPERQDREGPQHRVTLTQGFWLADTACTQALWLAVVGGDNPSGFKGDDELPVEQVSWDDVMEQFMPKLQALLPEGVEATLPSEAQWEYACRAGTQTPFSFGEQINPALVNYNGSYPYNNGPKGEYRAKTVPVKALPANAWGLYQMHGNVWEWCFDELRSYSNAEEVDPLGAVGDGSRALRGGSWRDDARDARSAYRLGLGRGDRYRYRFIGFRLALRFKTSQGAEPQGFGAGSPGVQRPQASQAEPGELRRGGAATPAQAQVQAEPEPELEPDGREAAARKNGAFQQLLDKLGVGKRGRK